MVGIKNTHSTFFYVAKETYGYVTLKFSKSVFKFSHVFQIFQDALNILIDGKSVISEEDPVIAYNFTGIYYKRAASLARATQFATRAFGPRVYSQYVVYNIIFGIGVLDYPRLVVYLPKLPPEANYLQNCMYRFYSLITIIQTGQTNKQTNTQQTSFNNIDICLRISLRCYFKVSHIGLRMNDKISKRPG